MDDEGKTTVVFGHVEGSDSMDALRNVSPHARFLVLAVGVMRQERDS